METFEQTDEQLQTIPGTAVAEPSAPRPRSAAPKVLPPFTIGGAIGRHPFLMILPVLLLVGAAIALGLNRAPTFTAETRLGVGRLDVSSQAIPGVVSAYQSLAATYSRLVNADGVVEPVAVRVGLPAEQVADAVEASPIPESSIIRLEARATEPDLAVRMANLTGVVLTRYVENLNQAGDSDALLTRFRAAAAELAGAQQTRDAAQSNETSSPSEESRQALSEATAEYEVASIRFSTIRDRISQEAEGRATTNAISTLNVATDAASDRDSALQRLVLMGILAGLALGTLLAIVRERSKRRRAYA